MALSPILRPSVRFSELDLTQRVQVILSTMGAVVGEFDRGPLEPTYVDGSVERFTNLYGRIANPQISFAHDTVTTFLTQSSTCLVKRVVNGSTYSGLTVIRDTDRDRILLSPFVAGTPENYETTGNSQIVLLTFDTPLITANSFSMDITDGVTVTSVGPVVFSSNHNTTLNAIATAIQASMNSFSTLANGTARVHVETTATNADRFVIICRLPTDASISLINATVTLGASQPVVQIVTDSVLFDVYAENPGSWSDSQYGIKLTNFDVGTRERYRIQFTDSFVTGNSFTVDVNGVTVGPIIFATTSDDMLADIAAALEALPSIASATVQSVASGTDNDREILIISQLAQPDALLFESPLITGGATQAIGVVTRTLRGIVPDHTFTLEVFDRTNTVIPLERFVVSLRNQISPLGQKQNIENVVNQSSISSINIRIKQNPATVLNSFSLYDSVTGMLPSVPINVIWLSGGSDGVTASSSDIRQGWDSINDRVLYPFNLMLNAGYTSISVQKHMVAVAEKRQDCFAILDAPSDKQSAQTLRTYRLEDLDIDTSYAAMYTPDVQIEDINTGERRYIPPSGPVGATFAYSDRLTAQMGAPAGLNRGKVRLALGLRHKYGETDMELLSSVNINYIIDRKAVGPVVFEEKTLQVKNTILSNVHARRILNSIKTGLADGLDYTLFEPHNEETRMQAVQLGETILSPIRKGGGLYGYAIVCDERNNGPEVIDADQLAYDVYLQIVRIIRDIVVRAILTRTGVQFEEIIDIYSVGNDSANI